LDEVLVSEVLVSAADFNAAGAVLAVAGLALVAGRAVPVDVALEQADAAFILHATCVAGAIPVEVAVMRAHPVGEVTAGEAERAAGAVHVISAGIPYPLSERSPLGAPEEGE
jgi:hypothetical protein